MKKGELSTTALISLVIVIAVAALAIYLIYNWTTEGSNVFSDYISIPVG